MKNNHILPLIQSIIHDSGITVKLDPSIDHPIPVPVFYRNNSNGLVCQLWPKGNSRAELLTFPHRGAINKGLLPGMQKFLFALGLERFLAHGRLVLYADLPTATYLRHQWRSKN